MKSVRKTGGEYGKTVRKRTLFSKKQPPDILPGALFFCFVTALGYFATAAA